MGTFVQQIFVNNIRLDFFFKKIFTSNGSRFYVSVLDLQKKPHHFEMAKRTETAWKIIDAPRVPSWIHEVEETLSNGIVLNR
jgi:hypothetical protein